MWAVTSHSCCIVSFAPVYCTKYNGLGRHWQSPGDSREMIAGEFDRKWSLTRMQSCKGSGADLDKIRAQRKQTRTPTNGCTDKVSFKGCAVTQPCGKPDPSLPW